MGAVRVWGALAALLVATTQVQGWSQTFDYSSCYLTEPIYRMPNTLDNLLGIVGKYENQTNGYVNPEDMAEMLIKRYRTDGIRYNYYVDRFMPMDVDKEIEKQELILTITKPTLTFQEDSFEPREECGLHMLLSHSTDDYPFSGINAIWDGTINRNNRGDRNRMKRSPQSNPSSSVASDQIYSGRSAASRANPAYEAATHPIENGVMETQFGPVAAGTLLMGMMSMTDSSSYSLTSIFTDTTYMPSEMKSKTIRPIYAGSLAGDLGQMALAAFSMGMVTTKMGPAGRYHNCTACAQQFSLQTQDYTLLSRAELFAGLDVLILKKAYDYGSSNYINSLPLTKLLKLYYSNKGLPNFADFKACNRLNLYRDLDTSLIHDQALNFMYAYQHYFKGIKDWVSVNDFSIIQSEFEKYLNAAENVMTSFISSYNYDDEGYSTCQSTSNSIVGQRASSNNLPFSETEADLIAIYAEQGTNDNYRDQRQMIADVSRRLRMNSATSAVGVLRGTDGNWLQEFTNITNIGDWACNFTNAIIYNSGGTTNRDSIKTVVDQLSKHYGNIYSKARLNQETSSGRSQVVLWQVPGTLSGDEYTNNKTIEDFRNNYPDVRLIFVGRNLSPYQYLLDDQDDFLSVTDGSLTSVAEDGVRKVLDSPRFYMYPTCDPNNPNITNAQNYRESSHVYTGAVTPNTTTYIRIPPQNFHFSEEIKLTIDGNVRTCSSRTNRYASDVYVVENVNNQYLVSPDEDVLQCVGGPDDSESETIVYKWPCDRYLSTCNPIYLSVTPIQTTASQGGCTGTNSRCEFPHQVKFVLSHEGMKCGASAYFPAMLLVLLPAVLLAFRN